MNEVNASIITIGDELLIGQTVDTNSAFIAQELNRIGIWVKRRLAVGDVHSEILDALDGQRHDCSVVIITGGLGPTADDITKPTLCEYFHSKLIVDKGALENVTGIFKALGKPLTDRNTRQAEVPDNCTVLPNRRGTAPGMWFEKEGVIYVSLPGVPHEMKGLMVHSVIPMLEERLTLPAVLHRTLLTSGIGESAIADLIAGFENSLPPHIKLAYLPAYGLVRLRLTSRGEESKELDAELDQLFGQLKSLVRQWLVADKDIRLEQALSDLLAEKKKTMGTAESCTGGYIAHLITSRPGASAIFKGGIVSYGYEAKTDLLGVQQHTLDQYGAVSEQTVQEMLQGALKVLKTDYGIAVSGIMGPDGGSAEKPVGTVWIAVGNQMKQKRIKAFFRYDRERNIDMTAYTAMTLLLRFIQEEEGDRGN